MISRKWGSRGRVTRENGIGSRDAEEGAAVLSQNGNRKAEPGVEADGMLPWQKVVRGLELALQEISSLAATSNDQLTRLIPLPPSFPLH